MDGRVFLRLSGMLLIAASGCQRQVVGVPSTSSLNSVRVDASQVKNAKAKELPPMVLVSAADFKAGEAMTADLSADRQQYIRDLARQDYEKALKLDRKCLAAYQGLARLYTVSQEHDRAAETYQQALRIAPNNAALWYELGMSHNFGKNWGAALECLNRATQIDPGNRSYVNAKGVVLAEAGRYEDSLNCFVRSNGEAMGHYRLAQTLHRLHQPELSRRYVEMALQKDPSLAAQLALQSGDKPSSPPAPPLLEQTAYQAATVPSPQVAVQPSATVLPQASAMDASKAENPPAPPQFLPAPQQQFLPPPPPSVNVQYKQPQ